MSPDRHGRCSSTIFFSLFCRLFLNGVWYCDLSDCFKLDWALCWWIFLFPPPNLKGLLWIFPCFMGLCSPHNVWQPLLAERPLYVQAALICERRFYDRCVVRGSAHHRFLCQVSDTNSTDIHYSRQQLLSLNSRECYLSRNVISHSNDLGIGYRLPRYALAEEDSETEAQ